jgi:hypothetical protein
VKIGKCVVTSTFQSPKVLTVGEKIDMEDVKIEGPRRFGCRADITEKSLIFDGDWATVCGGKIAVFCDGAAGSESQPFETVGGFQYGALFMTNIRQKILTYSEDGVVAVWSVTQM